jgi:hypothetical protein
MATNPPGPGPGDEQPSDGTRDKPYRAPRAYPVEDRVVTFVYRAEPTPPAPFAFSHDREKRLFVLTWADGRVESFRDSPSRQLVVEPDPGTGELPAFRNGLPGTRRSHAGLYDVAPSGAQRAKFGAKKARSALSAIGKGGKTGASSLTRPTNDRRVSPSGVLGRRFSLLASLSTICAVVSH